MDQLLDGKAQYNKILILLKLRHKLDVRVDIGLCQIFFSVSI